jgi:hypothetical protein
MIWKHKDSRQVGTHGQVSSFNVLSEADEYKWPL